MKNKLQHSTIFFLLLVLSAFSCFSCSQDQDDDIQEARTIQDGDIISVDTDIDQSLYPMQAYQANSKIIFKNDRARQQIFSLSFMDGKEIVSTTREGEEISYTLEYNNFHVLNDTFPNYEMNIGVKNDVFSSSIQHCVYINVAEHPSQDFPFEFLRPFSVLPTIICDDEEATFFIANSEDITLLDQEFNDVITFTVGNGGNDGLKVVYVNSAQGVVGFIDEFDDLFVFDRFE